MVVVFYILLLVALYLPFKHLWRFEVVQPWDVQTDLQIDVGGCDVNLLQGSWKGEGVYGFVVISGAWNRMNSRYQTTMNNDASSVQSVWVSSKACNDMPLLSCKAACTVDVYFPESPADGWGDGSNLVKIGQIADDVSQQVVVRTVEVVTLNTPIRVGGSTMRLQLGDEDGAAVYLNASLTAFLSGGDIRVHSTTIGPGAGSIYLSSSQNSVRVAVEAASNFTVDTRSVNNHVCLGAGDAAWIAKEPPSSTADACGLSAVSNAAYYVSFYDTAGTGYIQMSDFRAALHDKLGKCCGNNCPLSSFGGYYKGVDCDGIVQNVFPGQTLPEMAGRFGRLESVHLLNNIISSNDTTLIPKCRPVTTLSTPPLPFSSTLYFACWGSLFFFLFSFFGS